MTLVPSLLQAIVLMDGEALVLHAGEMPYVVTESGQVTIANAPLGRSAIEDVLAELLPADCQRDFADVGATQCVLPENPSVPAERFSVVAARGGQDVWVEIRRMPAARVAAEAAHRAASTPVTAPVVYTPPPLTRTAPEAPADAEIGRAHV